MGLPIAIPARRLAPALLPAVLVLGGLFLLVVIGMVGAMFGIQPVQGGYGPSAGARAEIPAPYLRLYQQAGARYGVDPWVLAAIGEIESDHGRLRAPGVRSGVNAFGCCAGPMQFSLPTWERFGAGGDIYDPADAIPAAARYLRASGAPEDYRAAIFAYNHADWYVADVLAKAAEYRGAARGALPVDPATVRELLRNPAIVLTPLQRADVLAGGIDPRLVATLTAIGRRHTVIVTALQSDHYPGTNHEAGRAMDIGAVDGEICDGRRSGACATLVRELAAVEGEMRSTELIYCWDPDGPDPRGFGRADHCDHIHWGMDG